MDVSIVTTVRNGASYLPHYFESILAQDFKGSLEVSIFDDGSSDDTAKLVSENAPRLGAKGIQLVFRSSKQTDAKGVGFGKNAAIRASSGDYLCFLDADDEMRPGRVRIQYEEAVKQDRITLIGSRFDREPADATRRFTRWANHLSADQLYSQAFTTHGPTVVAPTWFCSRVLVASLGWFREEVAVGFPEDLDLFYTLLRRPDGRVVRVSESLVVYHHHSACASHSVKEASILEMRNVEVQRRLIQNWPSFSIWNAGKAGKHFFNSLSNVNRGKVRAFIDVDKKKLGRGCVEIFNPHSRTVDYRIPIVNWKDAESPALICVKLDMTSGDLERYLTQLNWKEGQDFYHLNG